MNFILETESLPNFDGFDQITSIFDDSLEKFQNVDYSSVNFSNSSDDQFTNFLQFDLNNIFDSSNESESNSPQAHSLLQNELSANLAKVNSDELHFLTNIESENLNFEEKEDKINFYDTFINYDANIVSESDQKHTFINLQDLDDIEELSSESESCKNEDMVLTEEEKDVYLKEGYKIPTRKPLTKSEEKILKLVRRKIRNKVLLDNDDLKSAHVSRERKKNYIDGLEKRVDLCTKENEQLQNEVKSLKSKNFELMKELQKMQGLVTTLFTKNKKSSTAVLLVSFLITFCIFPHIDIAEVDSFALEHQDYLNIMSKNPIASNKPAVLDEINQTDQNKYIWEIYRTRYEI
ncbi:Cyclic AMP-responsive element-binding 3 3 [Brachionus plicatilis]|uniref:Cyclic AMP-responsive element-binding 3 3 n=1 Tax=Brachionus plicatilis TaxID=10195 RepID=A0A3M7Q5Y2_BRAPC|nr:Cyclic AMP-responsive element-binding 3 3 [Brachionus plicatilis]